MDMKILQSAIAQMDYNRGYINHNNITDNTFRY